MTRSEAVAAAQSLGLQAPRIMPHKGRDGKISWNLFHGPAEDRKVIILQANVSDAALKKAVQDGQA